MFSGHVYTLIGAFESNGIKLVKVRNPWGDGGEWKGEWSDSDKNWNNPKFKDLKKICNYVKDTRDSDFFMSIKNYHKYFSETAICRVEDDFIQESISF